ncbi:hypothetical protein [Fangia hongkongensis]|uniref:hypothetical protein n=1 Tax=Fangia hongkongensis TaxID=270495 RepID=UPI00037515B3|nr:hypothetical protein [Fangia hongkongensis]MBK2125347.1 hypothetical protein [Fangia hongkongensis]
MEYINNSLSGLYTNISILMSVLVVIVHLLCAMAVSKDLSHFVKRNITPQLMPSFAWIIVTLVSGIWGLLIYWLMHHSSLARGK